VAFAVVCILLLVIGFSSTNNAVYFLCFLMTVLGSQSLILTNRNTDLLQIQNIEGEDFFSDETGHIKVSLYNPSRDELHALTIETSPENQTIVEKLGPGERKEIQISLQNKSPGTHTFPALRISSDFPYYLSRSWKKHYSENSFHVFPARKGKNEFSDKAFADLNSQTHNQDDFKYHREYQNTDSPRRIDWKVTARVQKMMVKDYDQQMTTKVTLRWEDCPQVSIDEKKCQLSLWLDLAEKKNFEYALVLPNEKISLGKGRQHQLQCLRALLWS